MNRLILLLAACMMLPIAMEAKKPEPNSEIKVMTFNIRTDTPQDSLNGSPYRKDRVANAIRFYDADVIGMQEVRPNQLSDLEQRLSGYAHVGVGRRGDYDPRDEHCTL